ncbi:hypothetical protein D030_1401A, partial [Vibrio parahaemolyticus AQ3810]
MHGLEPLFETLGTDEQIPRDA